MLLDGIFRPANWAARLSHSVGLQGQVTVARETVTLAGRRQSGALRIGFASDFHAGPTTHLSVIEQAVEALRAERPDVVLFGGDFVTVRAAAMRELTPLLAGIHAPCGKFAVLGNHDLRANYDTVVGGLRRAGVNLLTNIHSRLPAPFDDISICGLDDPTIGDPQADRALGGVEGVRVVLMHSPEGLRALEDHRFELALCGHTHGGQIATPGGRAIVVPGGALNRRFAMGWHELNEGGLLLVSRGVGCSTVPFRMFAAPEVHIITLTGA